MNFVMGEKCLICCEDGGIIPPCGHTDHAMCAVCRKSIAHDCEICMTNYCDFGIILQLLSRQPLINYWNCKICGLPYKTSVPEGIDRRVEKFITKLHSPTSEHMYDENRIFGMDDETISFGGMLLKSRPADHSTSSIQPALYEVPID